MLFFVDKNIINTLRKNSEVLVMDCTYKTNRFNMPLLDIVGHTAIGTTFYIGFAFVDREKENRYTWVLDQLKSLFRSLGIRDPSVVVTDMDKGLIRALKKAYPDCKVLICIWHMNKDVRANCKPSFRGDEEAWNTFYAAYERVIYAHTKLSYDDAWADFTVKYATQDEAHPAPYHDDYMYIRNTWIRPWLSSVCKGWTNEVLHFDTTTTSRVEAMHRVLKALLKFATGDLGHVVDCVETMNVNQIKAYTTKLDQEKMKKLRAFDHNVFRDVVGRVSPHSLYKIEPQWKLVKAESPHQPLPPCTKVFKTTKGLPCAHDIKEAMKRQPGNWGRLNLDDFHPHWRFKKPQTVESTSEFRSDYQVIEEVMAQPAADPIHSDDDDWMDTPPPVEADDDWDPPDLEYLMRRLNVQFDNVVTPPISESEESEEELDFEDNNAIESAPE